MRVASEATICKEVFTIFLEMHASEYSPLPDGTNAVLMCVPINRHSSRHCSVLLDYFVDMAMDEVSAKRFMFRCSRPIEEQCPCQDSIIVMMAQRSLGLAHLPLLRDKSSMTTRDILYEIYIGPRG
jgi:hypothetical protein